MIGHASDHDCKSVNTDEATDENASQDESETRGRDRVHAARDDIMLCSEDAAARRVASASAARRAMTARIADVIDDSDSLDS